MKRIVLINPRYPFGKDQVFLGGSIFSVAARLLAMGHDVELIDLNIDRLDEVSDKLAATDLIGVSLTGSAYIPEALSLIPELRKIAPKTTIMLGGQVIEGLTREQFAQIFGNDNDVVQVSGNHDLAAVLCCTANMIPSPECVAYASAWQQVGEERMAVYLRREATLVISQGCNKNCNFCGAKKAQRESFREIGPFNTDLEYLVEIAKRNGIEKLEFYASNLDLFQNPHKIQTYLKILAQVQKKSGVKIRVRCLSCLDSFLEAAKRIPDFGPLLHEAGLWCVGFGADGTDENVWRAQNKKHNKTSDIAACLKICQKIGVRAELLMVLGFPKDNIFTLSKTVAISILATISRPNIIVRPYLAKETIPGNKGWGEMTDTVSQITSNPQKFYNLDFCAIGSPLTHPRMLHRWACNTAYLLICGVLTPLGKCTTSPLLPQGEPGVYGRLAKIFNRLMPFDR